MGPAPPELELGPAEPAELTSGQSSYFGSGSSSRWRWWQGASIRSQRNCCSSQGPKPELDLASLPYTQTPTYPSPSSPKKVFPSHDAHQSSRSANPETPDFLLHLGTEASTRPPMTKNSSVRRSTSHQSPFQAEHESRACSSDSSNHDRETAQTDDEVDAAAQN
jgi:hypothetical protein